jgi:hypothetical protein
MTDDTRRELRVWTQYFLVSLIAELGASVATFPNQPGNEINLAGYFDLRVLPHLYAWLLIFVAISSLRLVARSILRSKGASKRSKPLKEL